MDEVFMGCDDLFVGRVLEGAAEVFAVDLAMTQKGAEAGVENLRGGGEGVSRPPARTRSRPRRQRSPGAGRGRCREG